MERRKARERRLVPFTRRTVLTGRDTGRDKRRSVRMQICSERAATRTKPLTQPPAVNTASYEEAFWRGPARAFSRAVDGSRRERTALSGASALVGTTAVALWLLTGVRVDEIVRFVAYELGFIVLPGWLVYCAAVVPAGGRLRQIVFGWSLGYLLEILAFFVSAASGVRPLLYVYPIVVGLPAAIVARRRARASRALEDREATTRRVPVGPVWIGSLLCSVLLVYAAAVAFSQTPLPRDVGVGATYADDTVFTISIAAEALHHWPVTLPMVSGQALHYHLFSYMHMAAVSQVTGIDLSVVVLRLYEVPLLLLLTLLIIYAGKRIGGRWSVGLAAVVVVVFCGELDAFSGGAQWRFDDSFFYWLLASHTFLLGLTFFLPAVLVVGDLIARPKPSARRPLAVWALLGAFVVGCMGAKSYGVISLAAGLAVFVLWQLVRHRSINRAALLALALCTAVDFLANVFVFRWSAGGAHVDPLTTLERMPGVNDLGAYLQRLWGINYVPAVLGVPFGTFGLLGIPILGVAVLLRYKRLTLSPAESWFLSLFLAGLPALFLLSQSGLSQLFLLFFGLVPGAILAASGFMLLLGSQTPRERITAPVIVAVTAVSALAIAALLETSYVVGLEVALFSLVLVSAAGAARGLSGWGAVAATAVAVVGLILFATPAIWLARLLWSHLAGGSFAYDLPHAPTWRVVAALLLGLLVVALSLVYVVKHDVRTRRGTAFAVVIGALLFGVLNTPLDWGPELTRRASAGGPLYDQQYRGLTDGLYKGLLWIRNNTDEDAVLVVNNHSLYPDNHDSKYFYYSAFAQRRVVLESWDYTAQAAASGLFSLDASRTPFVHRLTLSNLVFQAADESALRALRRDYGADLLVVDKVHQSPSPLVGTIARGVFSDGDVDIYAIGGSGVKPNLTCLSQQGAGIAVLLGRRTTLGAALALRRSANAVGFRGLAVQRRGCGSYAVVLTGLDSLAQARDFKREAAGVGFQVRLECRTFAPQGGLNAVFGHRPTRKAAEDLERRAKAVGFAGLEVRQDKCGDWEVDLKGLETAAQRRDFKLQAARVGFEIVFERG